MFTREDFLDMYKITNNYTQAIAKIKNVIDDDRWVIIDYDIYFRGQMVDILSYTARIHPPLQVVR